MRNLEINIKKAQLKSFLVDLEKEGVQVQADVVLISEHGAEISKFTLSTSKYWPDEKKFDLPPEMMKPIAELMQSLEKVVVTSINGRQLQLEEKNVEL